MTNIVQSFRSYTSGNEPVTLMPGQVAINIPDQKTWYGDENSVPILFTGGCPALAPYLDAVNPSSAVLNETLDIVISGGNFDPNTVIALTAGAVVNTITVDNDTQITVNITVGVDVTTITAMNCDTPWFGNDVTLAIISPPVFTGTIPDIIGDEGVAITPYDASTHFSG